MARKTSVNGSAVRTWAQSEDGQAFLTTWATENEVDVPTVGARGKFSAALIAAFHKANPTSRYEVGHVQSVKVSGTRVTSNGRKIPVTVNATLPELRAFAQSQGLSVGARGRISAEVKAAFAAQPKA